MSDSVELPALPNSFARVCNDGYWLLRVAGTERFNVHDGRCGNAAQEVYTADQMRAFYTEGWNARDAALRVQVPDGWTIRRDGNEISVCAPNAKPGMKTVERNGPLSDRLLYALADALLAASPAASRRSAKDSATPSSEQSLPSWRDGKVADRPSFYNSHKPSSEALACTRNCDCVGECKAGIEQPQSDSRGDGNTNQGETK